MLLFAGFLTFIMITVMLTDVARYIIPNWLVALLLVSYPVLFAVAPSRPDWKWALPIAACVFVVGFALFAFRVMGGGDIKLLTVASLFTGKSAFALFIMYVGILGGILAVILLVMRQIVPYLCVKLQRPADAIPRLFTHGQPVPYGLAIAGAFLILLWSGQLPGIALAFPAH